MSACFLSWLGKERVLRRAGATRRRLTSPQTPSARPADNRVPEGTIRNPFLPWFNPVTRTFAPPIYNLRKQQVLQTECRRLGLTDVLPSGKKTPEGFANTTITAWTMKGPEGAKERVDLGQITWSGDYVKRVNPWGAGRFTPERLSAAELEARKVPGTDLDPWGAYAGRKIMFKGSLAERNKPKRQAAIDARMKDMPKRIATWKKVRLLPVASLRAGCCRRTLAAGRLTTRLCPPFPLAGGPREQDQGQAGPAVLDERLTSPQLPLALQATRSAASPLRSGVSFRASFWPPAPSSSAERWSTSAARSTRHG